MERGNIEMVEEELVVVTEQGMFGELELEEESKVKVKKEEK